MLSIAHLFGIAKRKRNSGFPLFLLYIREQNYKPGSVFDSHLSRRTVAGTLKPPRGRPGQPNVPIPVLLRIEFTATDASTPSGELLPSPFHPYLVDASSISFLPPQAAEETHFAASPLPTKTTFLRGPHFKELQGGISLLHFS